MRYQALCNIKYIGYLNSPTGRPFLQDVPQAIASAVASEYLSLHIMSPLLSIPGRPFLQDVPRAIA